MWVGIASFAVVGVTLWALVFAVQPAPHRNPIVDSAPGSLVVDSLPRSHVVGEQFASLAEQTEWLVGITSIEDCQNLDRTVTNRSPCETLETLPLKDQAMRNICRLKTMKVENPAEWELTLKKLATQPEPAPQ